MFCYQVSTIIYIHQSHSYCVHVLILSFNIYGTNDYHCLSSHIDHAYPLWATWQLNQKQSDWSNNLSKLVTSSPHVLYTCFVLQEEVYSSYTHPQKEAHNTEYNIYIHTITFGWRKPIMCSFIYSQMHLPSLMCIFSSNFVQTNICASTGPPDRRVQNSGKLFVNHCWACLGYLHFDNVFRDLQIEEYKTVGNFLSIIFSCWVCLGYLHFDNLLRDFVLA